MQLSVDFLNASEPLPIELEQVGINLPYWTSTAIAGLGSYFGGTAYVATARTNEGTLVGVAVYFVTQSENLSVGVSRGRYGFLGVRALTGLDATSLSRFVHAVRDKVKSDGLASLSLCLEGISARSFGEADLPTCDFIETGHIFLCDLTSIFNQDGEFIFRKYTTSTGLSQSLRMGKKNGYYGELVTSVDALKYWHNKCHIQRGKEQNGRGWHWSLFEMLIAKTQWVFYAVNDSAGMVVGGCFAICSQDVLEIFAISTPFEHMKKGANYILTEFIYRDAFSRHVQYINWQASNPPTGGVAEYKMKWGAKRVPVYTLNYIFDSERMATLSPDKLQGMFGEHYVIPYSWYEKR